VIVSREQRSSLLTQPLQLPKLLLHLRRPALWARASAVWCHYAPAAPALQTQSAPRRSSGSPPPPALGSPPCSWRATLRPRRFPHTPAARRPPLRCRHEAQPLLARLWRCTACWAPRAPATPPAASRL